MPLAADCLKRLNLTEQPFDPVARQAFLYHDALLDNQLERFLNALQPPGAIVLLSGISGIGRSIQLMRLIASLPEDVEVIAFRGRRNTSFASVDVTIRKHLHSRDDDTRSHSLNDLLMAHSQRGMEILIAIDDAHLLGSDILRKLLKLGEDVTSSVPHGPRFVMMTDTVMGRNHSRTLILEDAREIQHFSLAPLNHEQTQAYLRHRLGVAGNAEVANLFTPELVRKFNQQSRGLPGDLNTLAEEWLNEQCDKEISIPPPPMPDLEPEPEPEPESKSDPEPEPQSESQPEEPEPAREKGQASVLAAASVSQAAQSSEETPAPQSQRKKAAPAVWNQLWLLPAAAAMALIALILAMMLSIPQTDWTTAQPGEGTLTNATQRPDDAISTVPDASDREDTMDPEDTTNIADTAPGSVQGEIPAPESPVPDAIDQVTETRPEPGGDESASAPPISPLVEPDDTQVMATENAAEQPAGTTRPPTAPASDEAPEPDQTIIGAEDSMPPPVYERARTRPDLVWLSEQDPEHFTIQLIALQKFTAVERYLQEHNLAGARIISTRSLVIAVFGSFPDLESATTALASFPTNVLAEGYWIRSMRDIQDSVRR